MSMQISFEQMVANALRNGARWTRSFGLMKNVMDRMGAQAA